MTEILDDQIHEGEKLRTDFKETAFKYIAVLVVVAFCHSIFISRNGDEFILSLTMIGIQTILYLILGAFLRFIRIIISKWRGNENAEEKIPMWFQMFESGFAVWILFTAFMIIATLFSKFHF